jgi:predicted secreted protein
MATLTGNNGVLKIDDQAGTPTAIAAVRNFTIDITTDTIEKTAMGNDTRQYVKGLSSWSGSADIYFDPSEMPTSIAAGIIGLNPTLEAVGSDAYTIELYLNNTANKFSGECIVTGFSVNSTMDGMVEASISFQGSGAAVYAAS